MPPALPLLLVAILTFSGCCSPNRGGDDDANSPIDRLTLREPAGRTLATAKLHLPNPLPPDDQTFEGEWTLLSSVDEFPTDATRSGTYTGFVHDRRVSIDLNPGTNDNNITLSGAREGSTWTGQWSHSTFAGSRPKGTFTLTTQ